MKFMLPDGKVVRGRSYADVVKKMSEEKFGRVRSLATYRRATAHRSFEVFGVVLDDSTDRAFIDSMVANDLLRRV